MSVLAVVSKAVFEKEARIDGRLVAAGDTWPTSLYASQNAALEPLASGGALFLVTVRPGDELWLVGILEAPKKTKDAWRAAPNIVPVRVVSDLVSKLRFSNGKGISAAPGKLGMSLQTPRQLTDADEALLRGGAPSTSKPALAWRLDGYRKRALSTKLTANEKQLLEPFEGLLEQNDEDEGGIELADVVDTSTDKPVALYALWPVDAGALIDVASGAVLADVVESYFDSHGDDALRTRMREAVEEAAARGIRFRDRIAFGGGRDTPKRVATPAPTPGDPALLAEIRALHAELDRTKGTNRDIFAAKNPIDALQPKVFGNAIRPYPMRRLFELTEAERAFLELAVDHYEWRMDLGHLGLPRKASRAEEDALGAMGSPLSRMIGKKPPLAFDTVVTLEGKPHPLWAIFSDVLVGLRPDAVFLSALDAQPAEVRAGVWRQIASGEYHLGGLLPRNMKEHSRGWADPKDDEALKAKYHALLRAAFDRLGGEGERVALAVLAETDPNDLTLRRELDRVRVAALDGLARRAKEAGGALDAKYDAVLARLVGGPPSEWLVALFGELPPERAGELTGLDYWLLRAFPSESGMRRLVEKIASDVEWQSPKGSWAKVVTEHAAKFPGAALPLLRAAKPKLKRHPDGLDKAIEAAEKALAKTATKKPAKKK